MTEAEWLACSDVAVLAQYISTPPRQASQRKRRLFVSATLRWSWDLFDDVRIQRAIEDNERFADGVIDRMEMRAVWVAALRVAQEQDRIWTVRSNSKGAAWSVVAAANPLMRHTFQFGWQPEEWASERWNDELTRLLRDLFGNPFRAIQLEPECVSCSVQELAESSYHDRDLPSGHLDPTRLAILADALEESGCTHSEVLAHLRSPGPHVRGCWALDLLLGKE